MLARLSAALRVSGWLSPRTCRRRAEGVLGEFAGRRILAHGLKDAGDGARGSEGVGVVIAEDLPPTRQGVLGEFAGLPRFAKRTQRRSKIAR